jgi:outer membrane immunogenic protein
VKTQVSLPAVPSVTNLSGTKGGWTAGAGIETPFQLFGLFGPNWTSKTEYLYVDLGSSTDTFSVPLLPPVSVAFTSSTRVTEHIFRTGLNYHFNSPVVAKY